MKWCQISVRLATFRPFGLMHGLLDPETYEDELIMHCYLKAFLASALLVTTLAGPVLADGVGVSPEEFSLYMDWKDGQEDPRLQELDEAVRMKKIAKNLGVKVTVLEAAVTKVSGAVAGLAPSTTSAIREALIKTPLSKRVLDVELNTDTRHAVAYVKWRCGDLRNVDAEAAYVAWAVADRGQVVNLLGLWCVNDQETKMFSGQIGRAAFTKIRKARIPQLAQSRYIRLFQDVKRGPHR